MYSILTGFPPDIPPEVPPVDPPVNGQVFIAGADVCIPLNGNAEFDCTVQSGSPVVMYEWTRNFSPEVDTDPMILVDMVGSYTCIATNNFGNDTETSVVIGALFS